MVESIAESVNPLSERNTPGSEQEERLPKVTIGLPVYNGELFLHEALSSLREQTFQDFELIISDNASTDSTADIIARHAAADSRIRAVRQAENIGAHDNFLFVLSEARAELFMWASHDDIWEENWLEVLCDCITPEDIGVRGRIDLTRDGQVIAEKKPPDFRRFDFARCFLHNENDYRSHYAYSLFNREKLLGADLESFKFEYYPDALLIYCLLEQGSLRTVDQTSLRYRLHDENLGLQYSGKWKGWKKILYRIHPLRYYLAYVRYSRRPLTKLSIALLIPVKHLYAQFSFWVRGGKELITGKRAV
ncbi:MAG: glycosyltransferase [Woeseiaceae bacterium]|nr:glycosyltransferase [Woeseiaceae bacterium]